MNTPFPQPVPEPIPPPSPQPFPPKPVREPDAPGLPDEVPLPNPDENPEPPQHLHLWRQRPRADLSRVHGRAVTVILLHRKRVFCPDIPVIRPRQGCNADY